MRSCKCESRCKRRIKNTLHSNYQIKTIVSFVKTSSGVWQGNGITGKDNKSRTHEFQIQLRNIRTVVSTFWKSDWEETRVPGENPRLTNSFHMCPYSENRTHRGERHLFWRLRHHPAWRLRHHWLLEVLLTRLLLPLSRQTSDLLLYCMTTESTFLSIYKKHKYIEPFSLSLSVPNLQKNIYDL
jgi:hypothetical protein